MEQDHSMVTGGSCRVQILCGANNNKVSLVCVVLANGCGTKHTDAVCGVGEWPSSMLRGESQWPMSFSMGQIQDLPFGQASIEANIR